MKQLSLFKETNTRTYDSTAAMIEKAITKGFRHIGGRGIACRYCYDKSSVRKFKRNTQVVYACPKCGARY